MKCLFDRREDVICYDKSSCFFFVIIKNKRTYIRKRPSQSVMRQPLFLFILCWLSYLHDVHVDDVRCALLWVGGQGVPDVLHSLLVWG